MWQTGLAVVVAGVAVTSAGQLRAQTPPGQATMTPPPARTSTLSNPPSNTVATPTPVPATVAPATAAPATATAAPTQAPAFQQPATPTPAPTPAGPPPPPRDAEVIIATGPRSGPPAAGAEVVFAVRDPQPNQRYTWDFGDGGRDSGAIVTHVFTSFTEVTVTLYAGLENKQVARERYTLGPALVGVYASDMDSMITPADSFPIVALVRSPVEGKVTMRLSGAPFLRASAEFDLIPGDNWLQIPEFRTDTEEEPVLREGVIRRVGGTVPIVDGALVLALDYTDAAGAAQTTSHQPTVYDFLQPEKIVAVEYPNLMRVTGLPPNGAGQDNFYLRGNPDFHHPDDYYVRRLAFQAARRGGIMPDDPELAADNIFNFINDNFGDADPGDFNNDYNIARLIDEGTIVLGRRNGGYICIGQSYFMSALTRTVGIPSRELNIAVAKPNYQRADGVWVPTWFQEGAVDVWLGDGWQHYDLWLGFKGLNGYFTNNLGFQVWAAFNHQSTEFTTVAGVPVGLKGHNFNLFPGEPPQFEFILEQAKPGTRVLGLPDPEGVAVTGSGGWDFYRDASAPRMPAEIAAPPAKEILGTPETRP